MDELIIQKLIKNVQFLHQKFVESIDYSSHHTNTMSFDRVEHLIHSNRFYLLCFSSCLYENLGMKIVIIFRNKFTKVSEQL